MKLILLFFFIISGCGGWSWTKEPSDTQTPKDRIIERVRNYTLLLKEPRQDVSHGDALTFLALYDSFAPKEYRLDNLDIFEHEWSIVDDKKRRHTGQWNRNIEQVYFGEDEENISRSGISTEGLLGILHYIWTIRDKSAINRFMAFADDNNWILGDGPSEYTRQYHLIPIVNTIYEKLNVSLTKQSEDAWYDVWEKFQGYRGNVIAEYIYLKARVNCEINAIELGWLEGMTQEVTNSPIYHGLYNKFNDGDQSTAVELLDREEYFPLNSLPNNDKCEDIFDWSNGPCAIIYIYAASILDQMECQLN